jgi:MFS family permease
MFIGAWVVILGMIIISTSDTLPQFVVGRFVLGFGIVILTVAAPAYAIEIAPPHWRGRCTGKTKKKMKKKSLAMLSGSQL